MTEETPQPIEEVTSQESTVDIIWLVAHILSIINFIENKFGLEAIDEIARLAAYLEINMRAEASNQ